jgi:hypothetical protein
MENLTRVSLPVCQWPRRKGEGNTTPKNGHELEVRRGSTRNKHVNGGLGCRPVHMRQTLGIQISTGLKGSESGPNWIGRYLACRGLLRNEIYIESRSKTNQAI